MLKTSKCGKAIIGQTLVMTKKVGGSSSLFGIVLGHMMMNKTARDFHVRSAILDPVRVIVSQSNNPYFNLATEDYLFSIDRNVLEYQTLFLWRNDKTVVIGKHQNPFKECNLARMEADNVNLVRRRSGGGAVYQDMGNSIFTFLSPKEDYSKELNFKILMESLKNGFDIDSELSGRNDLTLSECKRKISGSAFKQGKDVCFHHGTMLLNLDTEALQKYLTPHKLKLQSKGVASVASRVCNLQTINPTISHDRFNEQLIKAFCERYGQSVSNVEIEKVDENFFSKNQEWKKFYDELSDKEWNYGLTPDFSNNIETKFDWGLVDLHIDYKSGKITNVKMYSDVLFPVFVEIVEEGLVNNDFSKEGIDNFENWMTEKIKTLPNIDNTSREMLNNFTKQLSSWMSIALFQ